MSAGRDASGRLSIRGAREHNLRGVDLDLPHNALIVFTGVSGSGKSSLALDTLYAEGRRRYVESLSAYARRFLGQARRPDVDMITGLSPAIAIEQKGAPANPRSTVGTTTEIYDLLRLLFARAGVPHCPGCGTAHRRLAPSQMVSRLMDLPEGTRLTLAAPVTCGPEELEERLRDLQARGFLRLRIGGEIVALEDVLDRGDSPTVQPVDLVVDRLILRPSARERLADSVELALEAGRGVVVAIRPGEEDRVMTTGDACRGCGQELPPLTPALFSFNTPEGSCTACHGLGVELDDSPGAAGPTSSGSPRDMSSPCRVCGGDRICPVGRAVRLGGRALGELTRLPVTELRAWVQGLALDREEALVTEEARREIDRRLGFLIDVGLDYLSLGRPTATLSGGELQRIRLARQIGSGLSGILYVLDEPSLGLHPRDQARLLDTLLTLRDQGNTLVVVEHDLEAMRRADWLVDFGPGAGREGGGVVAAGRPDEVARHPASLTGAYLSGRRSLPRRPRRPLEDRPRLVLRGARLHNLADIDCAIPLGVFTCVTGVSGSGKSSLIVDTLVPALQRALRGRTPKAAATYTSLEGAEALGRVVEIDQRPLGRSRRSCPLTVTGLFEPIRRFYSELPEARRRGYGPSRFSFNVAGGRCEACRGEGVKQVEMHFLPDVFVTCSLCEGRRFDRETLEVAYRGASIGDVLAMTADEARDHFRRIAPIRRSLDMFRRIGLGYLQLGQPATTLSGGESQRLRLVKELSVRRRSKTLYVMDEPTRGLHLEDLRTLMALLEDLVDQGNTLVVIEHHLDVIEAADYVIDLGPEGGAGGGRIVVEGPPEVVAAAPASHTGRFLRSHLRRPAD